MPPILPPPPPGTGLPNENKGPLILASCATVTIAAILSVAIRMFVRIKMVKCVGFDDYTMLIALALSVAGMAVIIPEVINGAGRHAVYLSPATVVTGLKLNWITQPVYLWAACFVKVSVAFFLFRIAPNKAYKQFLKGSIAFLLIYNFLCFLTIVLQCRPLQAIWEGPSIHATCFSIPALHALSYTNAGLAVVTDMIFAALPALMLRNVQMKPRVKIAIMAIMGLGIFACIASIIKFSYLPSYGKTGDFLWDSRNLTMWWVTETNIGIIAGSIPTMKPLFKRLSEMTASSSKSNNSSRKQSKRSSSHNSDPGYPLSPLKSKGTLDGKARIRTSVSDDDYGRGGLSSGAINGSHEDILGSKTAIVKTGQEEASRISSERDYDIMAIEERRMPLSIDDRV